MKPGDLQFGVVDFFSVMLPGAIAAAYADKAGGRIYAESILPSAALAGAGGWVLFGLVAYATGHLVFFAASQLDRTYSFVRKRVWPDTDGNAYRRAKALRDAVLGTTDEDRPMNTFSWAKATLQLRAKEAAVQVARLEADEKFFRSLCVVLGGIGSLILFSGQELAGGLLVLGGLASYMRYVERRYKSTQWAYYYVIAASTGATWVPAGANSDGTGKPTAEE